MGLPWIRVSFECYDCIRIPYMGRNCCCVYDGSDVHDDGTWQGEQETLEEGAYVWGGEVVTGELGADMGGRIMLAGKSQRWKAMW